MPFCGAIDEISVASPTGGRTSRRSSAVSCCSNLRTHKTNRCNPGIETRQEDGGKAGCHAGKTACSLLATVSTAAPTARARERAPPRLPPRRPLAPAQSARRPASPPPANAPPAEAGSPAKPPPEKAPPALADGANSTWATRVVIVPGLGLCTVELTAFYADLRARLNAALPNVAVELRCAAGRRCTVLMAPAWAPPISRTPTSHTCAPPLQAHAGLCQGAPQLLAAIHARRPQD
jgi:hypothetical protein